MPLFYSNRERRLWVWTLAVVAAIYSTLGLAATLAGVVDECIQGLLPSCVVDTRDILVNVAASVMAVAASAALGWAGHVGGPRRLARRPHDSNRSTSLRMPRNGESFNR